jgi:hypothetical protein
MSFMPSSVKQVDAAICSVDETIDTYQLVYEGTGSHRRALSTIWLDGSNLTPGGYDLTLSLKLDGVNYKGVSGMIDVSHSIQQKIIRAFGNVIGSDKTGDPFIIDCDWKLEIKCEGNGSESKNLIYSVL